MNNKIISVVIVVVLIVGGFLLFKSKSIAPTAVVEEKVLEEEVQTNLIGVKEFNIEAVPFSFTPTTLVVNKGDTVKITVKNVNGTHDLKIDEFGVATRTLKVGEEQTITFVADKTGSFQYYCSIGNHRAMGMVGTLTVR
ncbi:MAG: cupredoxin domain-containing protein [bacterium]|nr:cupredoxin domain-containing protein [bacterium]